MNRLVTSYLLTSKGVELVCLISRISLTIFLGSATEARPTSFSVFVSTPRVVHVKYQIDENLRVRQMTDVPVSIVVMFSLAIVILLHFPFKVSAIGLYE